MKIERILTIAKGPKREKGIDLCKHLTPEERLSLLEDLRQEMAKITQEPYPHTVEKTLMIVRRGDDAPP